MRRRRRSRDQPVFSGARPTSLASISMTEHNVFHIEIHTTSPPAPAHKAKARRPWVQLAIAAIGGTALVLAKVLPAMLAHDAPAAAQRLQCGGGATESVGRQSADVP